MTTVDLYNITGKKTGTFALPEDVFGLSANNALVHQVYVSQSANRRSGSAHTKVRSEVRGGGRKPWKQKGTGNARTGSIRNPIWRGGGTIFGPQKDKNFSKQINTKMRRKALLVALSEKARAGKVLVVESLVLPEVKTRSFATFLKGAGIATSALTGLGAGERETYRAIRNIKKVRACEVEKFNVFDTLNTDYIILSKEGIAGLHEQFIQ